MDEALNDFNNLNDEVNESINSIEEECSVDNDETPVRRNRRAPDNHEPSFNDKTCAQINEDQKVDDDYAFVTVMMKVFQQMSFEKGLREFGDRAEEVLTKESQQLHMRDAFVPRHRESLTEEEWKKACEAVNPIEEKKDGTIKGRTCADGRKQRNCIGEEDSASPTVSTEAVLLTGVMEAKEE